MTQYGNIKDYLATNSNLKEMLRQWGEWARGELKSLSYKSPALVLFQQKCHIRFPTAQFTDDELILIDGLIAKNLSRYDRALLVSHYVDGVTYRDLAKKLEVNTTKIFRFCDSAEQLVMIELKKVINA